MEPRYKVEYDGGKSDTDYRSCLQIYVDGALINEYWDGGEPEDNLFFRDYYWIEKELIRAYELGLEHGKENQNEGNQIPS